MKIISIAARKGGVGKTTITYLLSTYLAEINKKNILLIDADPQGNLSSMFRCKNNNTKLLFEKKAFNNIKDIIEKTAIDNVEIISSDIDLDETNNLILNETIRQRVVAKNLRSSFEYLRKTYDYIFVDTNASLNLVNQNFLSISDEIILIADKGKYSLKGIVNFIADWNSICEDFEITNQINTIILNRLTTSAASKQMIEFMNSRFQKYICQNYLKEYATINNAMNLQTSLSKDRKMMNLGNPIKEIVEELKNKNIL